MSTGENPGGPDRVIDCLHRMETQLRNVPGDLLLAEGRAYDVAALAGPEAGRLAAQALTNEGVGAGPDLLRLRLDRLVRLGHAGLDQRDPLDRGVFRCRPCVHGVQPFL